MEFYSLKNVIISESTNGFEVSWISKNDNRRIKFVKIKNAKK